MSSLTALKLERELEIARRAMAGETETTKLVMQWRIDCTTGRPVGTWVALRESLRPVVMRAPCFA
jgi:hypothetical protein